MIYARPGDSFTAVLERAATGLAGTLGVRIENSDGTNQTARTTAGIVELEPGSGSYAKEDLTAPSAAGTYVVLWDTGGGTPIYAAEELAVTFTLPTVVPGAGFATVADVRVRLGRDLTSDESALADMIIESVTGLIVEAVGRDEAWAAALDPVPSTLKVLCVEKALMAIVNPAGLVAQSEQLGAYQHSDTFQRPEDGATVGVFLSREERLRARRAVYGTNVTTARTKSIIDPAFPLVADDLEDESNRLPEY